MVIIIVAFRASIVPNIPKAMFVLILPFLLLRGDLTVSIEQLLNRSARTLLIGGGLK